ncbi:mynd finger domain-like protein [Moniliophthora roreri MCA 2997]|nr:mynd finger domain-like protein [Moniliophthora roreri MCA 2997]
MPDRKAKRCSRCRIAIYCSRECQRADWKVNHRDKCSPPPFRGLSNPVSELDIAFIKAHVRQTALRSHREAIERIITQIRGEETTRARTRTRKDRVGIILDVNGHRFPFSFGIDTLANWLKDCPYQGDEWREQREEVIAAFSTVKPDSEVLIVVNLPGLTRLGLLTYKEEF